jgi:hypothetical protein
MEGHDDVATLDSIRRVESAGVTGGIPTRPGLSQIVTTPASIADCEAGFGEFGDLLESHRSRLHRGMWPRRLLINLMGKVVSWRWSKQRIQVLRFQHSWTCKDWASG